MSVCNLCAHHQEAIAYPKESSHQGNTRILRGPEIASRQLNAGDGEQMLQNRSVSLLSYVRTTEDASPLASSTTDLVASIAEQELSTEKGFAGIQKKTHRASPHPAGAAI
jgi:hypothetical protein